MIGGWQSYIKQQGRAMFGRRRDGFLIEEEFTTATIVVTILERKDLERKENPRFSEHCNSCH